MANPAPALVKSLQSDRRAITLAIIATIGLVLAMAATIQPSEVAAVDGMARRLGMMQAGELLKRLLIGLVAPPFRH
jgi:hypothetical protein